MNQVLAINPSIAEMIPPLEIKCRCGHLIFSNGLVYSKCVNAAEGEARCRCKRWIDVPVYWDKIR